jgi:predicted hotdog family 3-hydroxylacyl-ACP dehydratase
MNTDLDRLLPQQAPMRLIDAICDETEEALTSHITIQKDNLFYDATCDGLRAWVGIEMMAQTVAAYAALDAGTGEPELGLLLSVRNFRTDVPVFKTGECLTVLAKREYLADNIGVFQCTISINNTVVASGKLNTILPPKDQLNAILQGKKS